MKITALTPIKFGRKRYAEGDAFEADEKTASSLIASASAEKSSKKAAGKGSPPPVTREALDQSLAGLPGDNTDPEYVVGAMRSHFGELFTAADEAKVRELVVKA